MNYIFDADLRSFFDSVSQQWLIRFLKHRINDTRMLRLIQKWLKAGVLEDGVTASGLAAASRERPKAWPQPSSSMRNPKKGRLWQAAQCLQLRSASGLDDL